MNISKKTILLCVMMISAAFSSINAQAKIGLTMDYSITNSGKQDQSISITNQRFSDKIQYLGQDNASSIGIGVYNSFDRLFLRVDAKYTSVKSTFAISRTIGTEGDFVEQTSILSDQNHFVNIPITAGIQLNKVQLGLGPVFSFKIDSDDMITNNSKLAYTNRNMSTAFQFFAGYKVTERIHLNASFQRSFTNLGDQFEMNNKSINLNVRPSTVSIGAAYFL